MSMLPGIGKMKNQLAERNLDEKVLKRQMAIIDSMTPKERRNPDVLKASRKRRIAAGSGTKLEDINRLLKMHRTMADVMKAMGGAKRGPMAGLANMLGLGGGGMPSPEQMAQLAEKMPGGLPPGMPGAPGLPPNFPGLPGSGPGIRRNSRGLAGSWPKLPGGLPPAFPGFGKEEMIRQSTASTHSERKLNVSKYPHGARRHQEAAGLSHRGRRQSRSPRDGRFIERLGYFNPLLPKDKTERLKLDMEKVKAGSTRARCRPTACCASSTPPASASATKRNNPEKAMPRKERKAQAEAAEKAKAEAAAAAAAAKAAAAAS